MASESQELDVFPLIVSQERPTYLVTIDDVTLDYLHGRGDNLGAAIQHLIEHHRDHMAKTECFCPYGPIKATALGLPDRRRQIVISEDADPSAAERHYYIAIHEMPEFLRHALEAT